MACSGCKTVLVAGVVVAEMGRRRAGMRRAEKVPRPVSAAAVASYLSYAAPLLIYAAPYRARLHLAELRYTLAELRCALAECAAPY